MSKALIDTEKVVLGAAITGTPLGAITELLTAEMFLDPDHRRFIEIMMEMDEEGIAVTFRLVAGRMSRMKNGEDPEAYLTACMRARQKDSIFNLHTYAHEIFVAYVSRRRLEICETEAKKIKEGKWALADLAKSEAALAELSELQGRIVDSSLSMAVQGALDDMAKAYQGGGIDGIPWAFNGLDKAADGPMQYGNFHGLLFDSAGGKTSLSLQQLRATAERGIPCLFLSFEQDEKQCVTQMLAQRTKIESKRLRHGQFQPAEYERITSDGDLMRQLEPYLQIEKAANWDVRRIISRVKRFRRQKGRGLVVIDHAKQIRLPNGSMFAEQINELYVRLAGVWTETGCAGLLLMQRRSDAMFRRDPEPIKKDAYGGDAAHESLDLMLGMWRPEQVYQIKRKQAVKQEEITECDTKILEWQNKAQVISLKNRYGTEGLKGELMWEPQYTRFRDIESGGLVDYDPRFNF